jgi:DNA-binding response OmpR family regulator
MPEITPMADPRLRILYSEDDSDAREIVPLLLSHEGFEIVCPESAQDVLTIAKAEKFDAYLLDSWTPGMSGLELCRRIRDFDSETPVIFFSAAASPADKDEAFAAGAQSYVTKPASADEVINALRLAISGPNARAVQEGHS